MRFIAIPASVCAGLLLTSFASAQELTPGKYTASYSPTQPQGVQVSIVLDVKSVEDGKITGTGERHVVSQSVNDCRVAALVDSRSPEP